MPQTTTRILAAAAFLCGVALGLCQSQAAAAIHLPRSHRVEVEEAAGRPPSLGIIRRNCFQPDTARFSGAGDRPSGEVIRRRELLKAHRRDYARTAAQRACGAEPLVLGPGHSPVDVEVRMSADDGRVWFRGLVHCGSSVCPDCAPRRARELAKELEAELAMWLSAVGRARRRRAQCL